MKPEKNAVRLAIERICQVGALDNRSSGLATVSTIPDERKQRDRTKIAATVITAG